MSEFKMPPINVSDPVVWYDSGDRGGAYLTGLVMEVGHSAITVMVWYPASGSGEVKVSVRHVDDPVLKHNDHMKAYGGWDYSPFHKRLAALEAAVAERQVKGKPKDA